MTTIAYRAHPGGGVMASDSRCSENGLHLTDCQKVFRLPNGALLGTAGDDDSRLVMALLGKARSPKSLPSREELAATKTDFAGIMVFKTGEVFNIRIECVERQNSDEWDGGISEIRTPFCATGSGWELAIGAMSAGASAEQAVEVACQYDLYSALPVQSMKLKEPASRTRK
jgi:hypothetical protein